MATSKAALERRQRNRELKKGKKCVQCGSEFELQLHHDKDPDLPRTDPRKDDHTVILCATCHFQEDFWKIMACYEKAMLKKYLKQGVELNNRFKKLSK